MIYITGDTHADFYRFNTHYFPKQNEMTKDDYVIICGDFGGIWSQKLTKNEAYWLKWLDEKPFTTLFVDGNHENFDRLDAMPVSTWHGGKVHRITDSVIHLMRGQVYNIDGATVFTFGGAKSHDISEGILEPNDPRIKEWRRDYTRHDFRINHLEWWDREMPNAEEMDEAICNLQKHDFKVDFIITHSPPSALLQYLGYHTDELSDFLQTVLNRTDYHRWFCGHIHRDEAFYMHRVEVFYELIRQIR